MFRTGDDSQPPRKQHKQSFEQDGVLVRLISLLNEVGAEYPMQTMNDEQMSGVLSQLDDENLTKLILKAVAENEIECLQRLRMPEIVGGFNYTLHVEDDDGVTPLQIAVRAELQEMVMYLFRPLELGGCGLPVDAVSIDLLCQRHQGYMNEASKMTYTPKMLTRQNSFIEYYDEASGLTEVYTPQCQLGAGNYGQVRLFQSKTHPEKSLSVKQIFDFGNRGMAGWVTYFHASGVMDEACFLRMVYPELSQTFVKHFYDSDTDTLSSRIVMQFIPGDTLTKFLKSSMEPLHVCHLLLTVAVELQRIHSLGVVHGDVKPDNILVEAVSMENESLPHFKVKFVDFGLAAIEGKRVLPFVSAVPHTAPERVGANNPKPIAQKEQDIFSFACLIDNARKIIVDQCANFDVRFTELSVTMLQFSKDAGSFNPAERPGLEIFIDLIKATLSSTNKSIFGPN